MTGPVRRFTPFTVALVGADGAGKTTIARRLERESPVPLKYLYMGINADASNVMLPTTRLWRATRRALGRGADQGGPPDPAARAPRRGFARLRVELKQALRLVHRLAEEWYRQLVAWYHRRRGRVVVFDRHFYADYYAHEIKAGTPARSIASRVHGWLLDRVYPRPELVIVLDAPTAVLFERKGEGTPDTLERRRQEYLDLRDVVENFRLVDAARELEVVTADVTRTILHFGEAQRG